MNIGIFFKHKESGGGIYQYFTTLLEALARRGEHQVYVFYRWVMPALPVDAPTRVTPVRLMPGHAAGKPWKGGFHDLREVTWNGEIVRFRAEPLSAQLRSAGARCNIDLMLYPTPERESFEAGIPYIMAVHDVGHRILPRFPEFTGNGVLSQREYVYTEGIRNASFVLVDSETGKEQVRTCYGAEPDKIIVLPFVPPSYVLEEPQEQHKREWEKHRKLLPRRFLFYPARPWPHKNHEALIRAIGLIKKNHGIKVPAVFTGAEERSDNVWRLRGIAEEVDVSDQIDWLGYLEPGLMRFLYGESLAMVMPTFLGPTNLPILEAFASGCPVITSDIPGARELVGNAGILVDPEDHEKIASSILRVWSDETVRETLKHRGKRRVADRTLQRFSERLAAVINAFEPAFAAEGKKRLPATRQIGG